MELYHYILIVLSGLIYLIIGSAGAGLLVRYWGDPEDEEMIIASVFLWPLFLAGIVIYWITFKPMTIIFRFTAGKK